MSFKLRLGVGGMVLFVPDDDAEGPVMHVLMPNTAGSGHRHAAQLVFPRAAQNAGPASPPPAGGRRKPAAPPVSLDSRLVDLSALSSGPALSRVPGGVADFEDLGGTAVDRRLFDSADPGPAVSARLTFRHGTGEIDEDGGGAWWRFGGKDRRLAIRTVWTLDIPGESLTVPLRGMNGEKDGDPITLVPDSEGVLDLWMLNIPAGQQVPVVPPPTCHHGHPREGEPATHFRPLYNLVDPPAPTFLRDDERQGGGVFAQGLDLFCIGATARSAPRAG